MPQAARPSTPRILSAALSAKVHRVRAAIEQLPPNERQPWRDALAQALGGVQVRASGPLPPGAVPIAEQSAEAREAEHVAQTDWDLQLANWLDRVYGIVTGRVQELGRQAWEGLGEGLSQAVEGTKRAVLGKGLAASIVPALAVLTIAGGFAYAVARR